MGRTLEGRCSCGEARFEVDLEPRFVCHCHCENCRRAHGAAFVTWAGFSSEKFRWRSGDAVRASYRTETGALRTFCRNCGSPLTFQSPRWPGEVHVAVAQLKGSLGVAPAAHVYADRAPAWCPITDGLPRHGGPSGTEPLT